MNRKVCLFWPEYPCNTIRGTDKGQRTGPHDA